MLSNRMQAAASGTGSILTVTATGTGTGGNPTSTQSDVNYGAPHADRRIVVLMVAESAGPDTAVIVSMTIGGVAATAHENRSCDDTGTNDDNVSAAIFSAAVPTGETGDIVINFGSDVMSYRYAVLRVIGGLTATGTNFDIDHNENNLSMNCNTATGDLLLVAGAWRDNVTITPTGVDTAIANTAGHYLGYTYPVASGETPRTVSLGGNFADDSAGVVVSLAIS